jgi:hypothetical protein
VIERAAALDPPTLRTLDAIHLATALSLGLNLGALCAYDERLASAAASKAWKCSRRPDRRTAYEEASIALKRPVRDFLIEQS